MSKIIIDLFQQTNKELKILALKNGRSLSNFISRYLDYCVKNKIVQLDENGEFIQSLTDSATPITLEQLKEAGIKNVSLSSSLSSAHTSLTPEQEQLQAQTTQLKLDKIRTTRIDYFKKKYKEIYGAYPPVAFRTSTYDYILLRYNSNQELDQLIDELDEYSRSNLENPEYEFYDGQNKIEQFSSSSPVYQKIYEYCLSNSFTYELAQMIEYPHPDNLKHNYDHIILPALEINKEQLDWNEIALAFNYERA